MMRIGVDASCWSNKRGFGRFSRELVNALIGIDQRNDYWFFADRESALEINPLERHHLVTIDTRVSPTEAASASGRRSFRDLWAMTRGVLSYNLDLFFFPAVYSYFPILNRTKIIGTIHDMTPKKCPEEIFPDKKLRFFWSLKERLAVWQANLILTVSEFSKQEIIRFYKLPDSRVATITEGPSHAFSPLPQDERLGEIVGKFHINPSERYLIYVGGISPHKNLRVLIQAYKDLTAESAFSNLKLMLVGDYLHDSFHSDYLSIRKLVHYLGLENKVVFTGYVADNDLVYLYNGASALVFPSLAEGFGLPAIEAMACGTPVVASHAGSLPEIVGEAGVFFDPRNKEEIINMLKLVLSNDDLREGMRLRGIKRAQLFSWERAAQNLIHIFEKLMRM